METTETLVTAPELLLHMTESRATKLLLDAPSPPTFFHGERLLPDRDYPRSLSAEDCRTLVHSLLSDGQRERLEMEGSVFVLADGPDGRTYRIFATCRAGVISALITAS